MILETYGSLDEKEKFFDNKKNMVHYYRIDTTKKLKETLEKIKKARESSTDVVLVTRGVSEAKYKLYTSAQREWMTNEWGRQGITFPEFVGRLLDHIKTDFIKKYFQSMGIAINDLLLLSFLQHYGAPSPLLDFTTDPKVALFFALEHMQGTSSGSQGIENYFSIYIILMDKVKSLDVMIKRRIDKAVSRKTGKEKPPKNTLIVATKEAAERYLHWLDWFPNSKTNSSGLCNKTILFLTNPLNIERPSILLPKLYWSNPNIVAQKGCFLLNTHEKQPLEERLLEEKEKRILKNAALCCFDIHKSLAPYIREKYLKSEVITKETIYPDFNAIANDAYYKAFKRCPKERNISRVCFE